MSMQPRPQNPIELKKQQTRRNARNAAVSVVGGVGGGLALWLLLGSSFFLVLGLVVAVAGGVVYGNRVRRAIEPDPNSPYGG